MNISSAAGSDNVTLTMTKKELTEIVKMGEPTYEILMDLLAARGPCKRLAKGEPQCKGCKRLEDAVGAFGKLRETIE